MTVTYQDLLERLKKIDEVSLLEILEISSEDIVDAFQDKIEEKAEQLSREFEDVDEEEIQD